MVFYPPLQRTLTYLGLPSTFYPYLFRTTRKSMPGHLEDHWANGGHIRGLFWIRPLTPIGQLAQELILVWETTEAEEWIDILDWIPF